ncbi:uncharacterized protein LOC131932152 [Physella acuta]|uniref:uncharacterized protein LOC131932152 n=1 Tax=Physella acuta TaxID=109671 RepID=UPI0027DBEF7E|nr:uncharacterized protein LOC131932152 [Physella acuta]
MKMLLRAVTVMAVLVHMVDAGCSRSDWWASLDRQGLSKCNGSDDFISGFYRNDRKSWEDDPLQLLEEAECCSRVSPWTNTNTQVVIADWWLTFDQPNSWVNCPAGYFLNGLYRSQDSKGLLFNIEEGRCSKPRRHPRYYGHCYDHDISACFDNKGICKCNTDYYVTGLYRGSCDKLYCLETLRCCKMADGPEILDELSKVKTLTMDTTMSSLAYVAHYLGFGYCSGCRTPYVGEDFIRTGDKWIADKSRRCEGYMSDIRLSMAYGDWSFVIKDIIYGTPVTKELAPEVIDSGTITNNLPTEMTQSFIRSENSVRRVSHTTNSRWKNANELNVQVSYTPADTTGIVGGSGGYKFNYENSTSTTDETNKEQSRTLSISTSKTIPPYSAAKWSVVLTKTSTHVPYMANIMVKFSAELTGFLRWYGESNLYTNYHFFFRKNNYNYPILTYKCGNSSVPFYTALKKQSDTNYQPWLWNDMKKAYPYAQSFIDDLSTEDWYTFTLAGSFDDVIGKRVELHWDTVSLGKRSDDADDTGPDEIFQNSTHVAKPLPNDVPPVALKPSKVG